MSNNGIVNIHGRDYMTVARRVELGHEAEEKIDIMTELISSDAEIVYKAVVITKKGTFTGHSSVRRDTMKQIEKQTPYEVAETSAVGRALGFAGYGIVESIASADEMVKATAVPEKPVIKEADMDAALDRMEEPKTIHADEGESVEEALPETKMCTIHEEPMRRVKGQFGIFYSHGEKQPNGTWRNCSGKGFKD